MKRNVICVVAVLLLLTLAWVAFGQPADRQRGFGRMREAQLNAITAIQEQATKLKDLMEQPMPGMPNMQGRSFQDMSEEERTQMREAFTKRREQQQAILATMEQELMKLKGPRQLMTEHEESLAPLKELLASAQRENAKETAGKAEQLIAQRQKQFDEEMAALGYTPEQLERMRQMPQRRPQQ